MKHSGDWLYHDDDCLCGAYTDAYCNRGGYCWSCCGACAEDSECSAPRLHPTHWSHFRHHETIASWSNHRPVYRSAQEIRALLPEAFADSGDGAGVAS